MTWCGSICFPYAGGTSSVFHDWQQHLGERVRVVPVLLPGRGLRLHEAPYSVPRPFGLRRGRRAHRAPARRSSPLFGHSMGALLAYEVASELRDRGIPEPLHLFVAGSRAPHLYGDRADHRLDDDALLEVLRDLGGLGVGSAVRSTYLERRLPALRADLKACELYKWTARPPLHCPVTAVSATDDPIATEPQMTSWRSYTAGPFHQLRLPGNHFFLNGTSRVPLLGELRSTCDDLRPLPPR